MDRGWTKSWRKRWDSDLATNPNANHLFQYLIDNASYKERDASFRYQCVRLQMGDALVGRDSLSTRTGLSPRTVRTCLNYLKTTSRVTIRATNRFSIISIIKWSEYQGDDDTTDQQTDQQVDQQTTKTRPASDHIQELKKLEKDQKQERMPRAKVTRFIPPTLEEVIEYCKDRNNGLDAVKFHASYTAKGWKMGKTPVVDWRACVVTWERGN